MRQGRVHSLESFGSVEGPGVRFVIFMQGCRLRCRYCHNPDTWRTDGGTRMYPDEILDRAERCRPYWGNDGGITVSGGEPLLQIEFLVELLREAKRRGMHVCVDTAGQPFTRSEPFYSSFRELCGLCDLFLADIKHIDSAAHRVLTGADNSNILDMFRFLSDIGKPVWIRYVLVPGLTDDDNALHRLRMFMDTLCNVERIEVLPYHNMGAYKWDELGVHYTLADTQPPTAQRVKNANDILKASPRS